MAHIQEQPPFAFLNIRCYPVIELVFDDLVVQLSLCAQDSCAVFITLSTLGARRLVHSHRRPDLAGRRTWQCQAFLLLKLNTRLGQKAEWLLLHSLQAIRSSETLRDALAFSD